MQSTRRIPRAMLVWLALCLVAPLVFGQALTHQLTGIVTDQTGAVIPDARIALRSELSGDVRRTVSNSDGYFIFAALPSGTYNVTVEAQGFAAYFCESE